MPIKVLIIDDVATNRIVLKVKLSAAFYEVFQASSASEALDIAEREAPDIIVTVAELEGESAVDLIRQLSTLDASDPAIILALSDIDRPQTRLELMRAGAFDVCSKPLCDNLLLARLRNVSRRRQERAGLEIKTDTVDALGFDEAPAPFSMRARITAIEPVAADQRKALKTLVSSSVHDFGFCSLGTAGEVSGLAHAPDVMLVVVPNGQDEAGLTQLAELRLADPTRHARLMVALDDPGSPIAGRALDIGADDVIGLTAHPEEFEIRIETQLRHRAEEERLRLRLQDSLEAAITDPLTGLYNRRYALSALSKRVEASARDDSSFAVMVADLDNFKSVNDTYGHRAGDIALKRVAAQLRSALADGDIVARFGGEEFLILLPGADRNTAREVANRLRHMVRETDIYVPGRNDPIQVTISIGVTVAKGLDKTGQPSVEALLGQADQALYFSKSDGRDTVSFNRPSAA